MTVFDATLTIRVPEALADVAAMIGRAMDPDIGGAESFIPDPNNPGLLICRTPCRQVFREQAFQMLTDSDRLYQTVAFDYARRWQTEVPPTHEQCAAFVAGVTLE